MFCFGNQTGPEATLEKWLIKQRWPTPTHAHR